MIVTASLDGTARVWDPRDPGRELARFDGHTGSVSAVAALDWPGLDHPVIVTASAVTGPRGCGIRVIPAGNWPASTATPAPSNAVAALDWPGLDHPVIVTAGSDGTARVWDPRDPGRELARFDGHTSAVQRGGGAGLARAWTTR